MLCLSPVAQVWMLFFSDIWMSNSHLPAIRRAADLLDIRLPWSLAYHPMTQERLHRLLVVRKLSSLLPPQVLDTLYSVLEGFLTSAAPS